MSEASLAAQRLAVLTMRARSALTALCPAANIMDTHATPSVFPCILIGEAQTVADEAECVVGSEVFLTIHVWTAENTMTDVKSIAGETRRALYQLSGVQDGFALDFSFGDSVFLRDPDGIHSHGVLTFNVMAEDTVGL